MKCSAIDLAAQDLRDKKMERQGNIKFKPGYRYVVRAVKGIDEKGFTLIDDKIARRTIEEARMSAELFKKRFRNSKIEIRDLKGNVVL